MDDARDTRQRLTHWNHILRQACARSRNDKRRFDDTRRRESHGRRSIHCRTVYEHRAPEKKKKEKKEKGKERKRRKKDGRVKGSDGNARKLRRSLLTFPRRERQLVY